MPREHSCTAARPTTERTFSGMMIQRDENERHLLAKVYIYADETGNLDYEVEKAGASEYFGFGTAVFDAAHPDALWGGLRLRARLAAGENGRPGVGLPKGFHAIQDTIPTKVAVFKEIARQAPRFDSTFLLKRNAQAHVRAAGSMRLYKMAWYLHFKYIAQRVSNPGDTLIVIVASFGTKARQTEAQAALEDVCRQMNRKFVLCVWDASTAWGLQVADYGLWAIQRDLESRSGTWYADYIDELCESVFAPWGRL